MDLRHANNYIFITENNIPNLINLFKYIYLSFNIRENDLNYNKNINFLFCCWFS